MSFLNPALLGFLAAVAVPILIHFLNRRRFRQVTWAAMRFLQASLEKNRRRMELEDLLLLAVRCLVVGLLAFALARPALRSAMGLLPAGRAAAVVVLDRSASLGAGDGTGTRMDQARAAAVAAVDAFPPGSALAVLLTGDRVEAATLEPTQDFNLVRKTLRETTPSDLGTDHAVGVARAAEILADQTALRKEIVLVTDRQAWGWRRLPDIRSGLAESRRDARLRVVLVGDPLDDNLAVAELERSGGFAAAREPLRFHADLLNWGRTPAREVRATLHVNGGPAVDDAVIDVLAPGESRRLTFFGRLPGAGYQSVTVRLPGDRLSSDDERTLVVRTVDTVRVLVVDGDPESNAAFLLRHALQPVAPDLAAGYFLQPRVIAPGQLALTRLGDYDAILLSDVATLPSAAVEALARRVREGGALLCFVGPKTDPAFWNGEMLERAGLAPAAIGDRKGDPSAETASLVLQAGPYEHPVFSLWNEAGAGSLTRVGFRAAWELRPAAARTNATEELGEGRVMVRFADGTPAAVERGVGRGRVMLLASTAGTGWNDLAVRPAFVPLLHRSLAALAEAQEARLNLRTGARATVSLPVEQAGRDVVIVPPGEVGRRLTRSVRPSGTGAVLEFEETDRGGLYQVLPVSGSQPVAAFATQPDRQESDLTELTPEGRAEIGQVAQVIDWVPGMDLRAAFDRERVGVELWLPLVVAVLLLGILEVWMAQAFSRSK